ncbi:MAG: 4'-phosphopantetheinyl transferase superfamily protein [Elusimicrobiaceae bacterium]|nr:4'-phosphopantetheinyl transferase superfamily protein [Elusimicrobiaceae bacterium]
MGTRLLASNNPMSYELEVIDLTNLPPADGILSPQEQAYYQTLRFPKRRTEWLGGRFALKRLVARVLGLTDLRQVEVLPQESGKPKLLAQAKPTSLAYSITHSHGFAVAAVSTDGQFLGIDLEKIEHRLNAWKTDFFHPDELTGDGDDFLTALWTQKEALVKLLGTGLSLRSNEVCCIGGVPRFTGRALEIYKALGQPAVTVKTEQWPSGFMFSVAQGQCGAEKYV